MYNTDLDEFYSKRLEKYTSNYIRENGFRLPEDTDTSLIAINLPILLPELISYWHGDKRDIEFTPSNNPLKIYVGMGHGEIAIVSNEEDKIQAKDLVIGLKDLNEIKMELQKFYQVIIDIYDMAEGLSKDIGKNIVKNIQMDDFDEMCNVCKD